MEPALIFDSYATQKETAKRHKEFILRNLGNGPKLFGELLEIGKEDSNGIKSPTGLSKILDEMQNDNTIDQDATKKDRRGIVRNAYSLTLKGKRKVEELWHILYELEEFKRNKADHTRHEEIGHILGLDADVIFGRNINVDNQIIINKNLDNLGKYIASFFAEKVKSGEISKQERWQRGIIGIEFDAYDIIDSLEYGLRLLNDLKKGSDIFKDKGLHLGPHKPYNLFLTGVFVRYAEVYNDNELTKLLSKLFNVYKNNPKKVKEDFELDFDLNEKIVSAVVKEKDPITILKDKLKKKIEEDNKIFAKSLKGEVKFGSLDYNSFLARNVILAQLINYQDKELVERLRDYEKTLFKGDKHMGHTIILNLKEVSQFQEVKGENK